MLLPHPLTGAPFASPVPPGAGWPGDPARPDTPVATTATRVRRLAAAAPDLAVLDVGPDGAHVVETFGTTHRELEELVGLALGPAPGRTR